jgi:hypothetical protein
VSELLAAACDYLRLGYHPIPCGPRSKRPLVKWEPYQQTAPLPEEVETWWSQWPDANVALVLGRGTFAVDLDGGADAQRLLFERGVLLPGAPRSKTAHGAHVFLAGSVPDRVGLLTTNGKKPQVDIRGVGYVIAPPSIHPDGPTYEWVVPLTATLPPAPPELLALIHGHVPTGHAVQVGGAGWVAELLAGVPEGQRDHACTRLAGYFLGKNLPQETVETILLHTFALSCTPPADADMVRKCVRSISKRERRTAEAERYDSPHSPAASLAPDPRWTRAVSVTDFLAQEDHEVAWLEEHVLAPGSLTEIFAPRGLGKSHVLHGILVKLARRGTRCLLLDRDNSRREVKRRLRAWGAQGLATLWVKCRDDVPPLTDTKAWAEFPVADYDVVGIDSLDATAEGVGEQDSARPARAIAPILDLCHRAGGPAVVVLGNVIKSGAHSRGSGVVEDRADIAYEVRDATGFTPSGTKDWWLELPPAGVDQWASRATRRKRRDTYRLAFVSSKFRIGEEPDPFVYELNLGTEPWTLRLCTEDVVAAGREAQETAAQERAAILEHAATALREALATPMTSAAAEQYLKAEHRVKRAAARALLANNDGVLWTAQVDPSKPGRPKLWRALATAPDGVLQEGSAAGIPSRESPALTAPGEGDISADRMDSTRRKYPTAEPRMNGGDSNAGISAAEPGLKGPPAAGEDRL